MFVSEEIVGVDVTMNGRCWLWMAADSKECAHAHAGTCPELVKVGDIKMLIFIAHYLDLLEQRYVLLQQVEIYMGSGEVSTGV